MAKISPAQTYCADCHCVIPVGWPKVAVNDGWRCATCEWERQTRKFKPSVGR